MVINVSQISSSSTEAVSNSNNEPDDYTNGRLSPATSKNQEVGAGDTKVMDTNQQRQIYDHYHYL